MTNSKNIKVLIVGAGTSGLMLALLLEIAGIDYLLLEKKSTFLPPSRSCVLSAVIAPLLEQLGFLKEIEANSLPTRKFKVKRQGNMDDTVGEFDGSIFEQRYGYPTLILPRPALYNVLLQGVPKQKILLGRRVLSSTQSDQGVLVRCADGSTYSGDLLVGADGPNSAVRANLYRQIETAKKAAVAQVAAAKAAAAAAFSNSLASSTPVPKSVKGNVLSGTGGDKDSDDSMTEPLTPLKAKSGNIKLPVPHHHNASGTSLYEEEDRGERAWTVMGITQPLDRMLYPDLDLPYSDFVIVMGQKNKHTYWCMPTANRRLQWAITTPIEKSDKALGDDGFKASEFGQEAIDEMCSKYEHYACPYGGTMSDIFKHSPRPLMSKVLVQEKIYDIWHSQRTVLMGNAVHKFPASAGMVDSINLAESATLANLIYQLESNSMAEIRTALTRYQQEREPHARGALQLSKQLSAIFAEQGLFAGINRKLAFSKSTEGAHRKLNDKAHKDRPQVVFLPMVPHRGVFARRDPLVLRGPHQQPRTPPGSTSSLSSS